MIKREKKVLEIENFRQIKTIFWITFVIGVGMKNENRWIG